MELNNIKDKFYEPIEFPGEKLYHALRAKGITIDEPLFCKYNLPKDYDEQKLQDYTKQFHWEDGLKNKAETEKMVQLAKQISGMNLAQFIVGTRPMSVSESVDFLIGVASKFTPRDIAYYVHKYSKTKYYDPKWQKDVARIQEFVGEGVMGGLILDPSVAEKIAQEIDKQQQKEKQYQNIEGFENWKRNRDYD